MTTTWRYWLKEHRLLLWAVMLSPCHLFWLLPLLGALLAPTPFDGLFGQIRFPLEVTLAVLLSVHSIVVIARWALRPKQGPVAIVTETSSDSPAIAETVVR